MNKRIRTGVLSALLAGGTLLGATAVSGAASAQVDDATTVDTTVAPDGAQPDAADAAPEDGEHRHGRRLGMNAEALAELLGMDVEELHTELRAGTTLADLAAANGVETSAVVDLIVDARTERIEQGVENGRLTAEQAATRLEGLEERVATRVEEGRPDRSERPDGERRGPRGERPADAPTNVDAPVDGEG